MLSYKNTNRGISMAKRNQKIFLIINTGYFGDVILTSKLTRDIKKNHPNCHLVYIADTPYQKAAKGLPGVDEVICYDRKKCHNIFSFIKFLINFPYKNKINYTLIPHGRKTNRTLLAHLLGSKKIFELRKGINKKSYRKLRLKNALNLRFAYEAANMLFPITGEMTDSKDIEFNVCKKDEEKINTMLNELNLKENLIAINPNAGDDWKRWDVEEVVKLAKELTKDGKKVILTGVLKDGCQYIKALDKELGSENYINLVDKTSISELGALYKRCEAVISVDTGSMHMSCAVGTPTIALFFKKNFNYWGPLDTKKNRCLFDIESISAETVMDELRQITYSSNGFE